jgi:nucleotide-binding universal stress UspA family protein
MLEKLLLAVDDSAHSRKAVPAAAELARAGGGTVNVLHVRELHYPVPTVPATAPATPSGWSTTSSASWGRPGSRPRARCGQHRRLAGRGHPGARR